MIRTILFFLVLASTSFSMQVFFNALSGKVPSGSLVHKCQTCHNGSGLNLFGTDFYNIFVSPNNIKFPGIITMDTPKKWEFILNNLDSNKNGQANLQDIVNKLNPGK